MSTPSVTPSGPLQPSVLVLPAFGADDFVNETSQTDELVRWLDAYPLDGTLEIPGANAPIRYTEAAVAGAAELPGDTPADRSAEEPPEPSAGQPPEPPVEQPTEPSSDQPAGLAVTTTGMGKAEAATTVSALCASPRIDLTSTTILTVGIAGGPPEVPVGSIVVAETVVDWDLKHRFDPGTSEPPIDQLTYRPYDYVWHLNPDLVASAVDAIDPTALEQSEAITTWRRDQGFDRATPAVETGVTITGDEFWHGESLASQAGWLCEQYGLPAYRRTEMEDAATAAALARHDRLDQYCSVRAVANYDRPVSGITAEVDDSELELGMENAFRAGRQVVDLLLDSPDI